MCRLFSLRITIELDSQARVLTVEQLEQVLSTAAAKQALLDLFRGPHPQPVPKRRGTIGGGDAPLPENERILIPRFRSFVSEGEGCRGEEGVLSDGTPERWAAFLADRLDDWSSYAWYLRVSRQLPEAAIRDILTQVLDVPDKSIRRSRGALFTSLARRAMNEHAHPSQSPFS